MRFLLALLASACAAGLPRAATPGLGDLPERYVKVVLAAGVHDKDLVDAYYGPPEWRAEAQARQAPLAAVRAEAEVLLGLARALPGAGDDLAAQRARYLVAHLTALVTRLDIVGGKKLSFDEESRLIYGVVVPPVSEARFAEIRARLEKLLPGEGTLQARVAALDKKMTIPAEKLAAVWDAALAECRRRTLMHIALPEGESFSVEYVKGTPWSAYNWYKGGYRSVIQVNTDLPAYIDGPLGTACHEGYPGHHVYNALLEKELVRGRGFVELTIYPLFSPMSFIAEGSANAGIDLAFPPDELVDFLRRVLFPLAGLDPAEAARYREVKELTRKLDRAQLEAGRLYLDGKLDADAAVDYLVRNALEEPERARKRIRFFDAYRSYIINYSYGEELVTQYLARRGGDDPGRRWEALRILLSTPRLAADLERP